MAPKDQIELLRQTAEALDNTVEGVVLNTLLGNIFAGKSNQPLADYAATIAQTNLNDIELILGSPWLR